MKYVQSHGVLASADILWTRLGQFFVIKCYFKMTTLLALNLKKLSFFEVHFFFIRISKYRVETRCF